MNAKEAFLKGPHRAPFEQLVLNEHFQPAMEAALLALVQEQNPNAGVNDSWDAHSQLVGARRFIEILEALHKPETVTKIPRFPNLKTPSL